METISVRISSIGAVSMIRDISAIFRTNCAIAGARAGTYCEDFCGCRAGKFFYAFGPQFNTFVCWNLSGSNLSEERQRRIRYVRLYITVVLRCFFLQEFHITPLYISQC